jgi:hypothetical protein
MNSLHGMGEDEKMESFARMRVGATARWASTDCEIRWDS